MRVVWRSVNRNPPRTQTHSVTQTPFPLKIWTLDLFPPSKQSFHTVALERSPDSLSSIQHPQPIISGPPTPPIPVNRTPRSQNSTHLTTVMTSSTRQLQLSALLLALLLLQSLVPVLGQYGEVATYTKGGTVMYYTFTYVHSFFSASPYPLDVSLTILTFNTSERQPLATTRSQLGLSPMLLRTGLAFIHPMHQPRQAIPKTRLVTRMRLG